MSIAQDMSLKNGNSEQAAKTVVGADTTTSSSPDLKSTSLSNLLDRSTLEQLKLDARAEFKQLHNDAKSIVAELFTPLSDFSDFINSDPGKDAGASLDTGTEKGLQKERNDLILEELLRQSTAPIINQNSTSTDNQINLKTASMAGSLVTGAAASAFEANRQEDLQKQEVQNVLGQYSSALANNPSLAGKIAAAIPPNASRETIEQIVRNFIS
jgi:hypothetical protein